MTLPDLPAGSGAPDDGADPADLSPTTSRPSAGEPSEASGPDAAAGEPADAPEADANVTLHTDAAEPTELDPGDDVLVADETPADETPADETPADQTPADQTPADETPADETPADETPADQTAEGEPELEVLTEDELLEADAEVVESPYDRPGRWYVVHTQSGYEKKVKQNLEARIGSMNMEDRIHEVVIPMEDVVEFKAGKKQVVQKKMFPGYLLVRCSLDDDSWFVVRNTPGVTGFVGQGAKPSPLPRRDVETFLQVKKEGEEVQRKGKARLEYEMGETVRVKEGPFAEFSGEIVEINEDQLKVKVLVNLFGRETPVELEFSQVAKL